MKRRTLEQLVEEVHEDHLAGQLRTNGPMGRKPYKLRRRPDTAIIADAAKQIVRRGTKHD